MLHDPEDISIVLPFIFQVLGSKNEFHFAHKMVAPSRNRRSILHTRKLKTDPLVSDVTSVHARGKTS